MIIRIVRGDRNVFTCTVLNLALVMTVGPTAWPAWIQFTRDYIRNYPCPFRDRSQTLVREA